MSLRRILADESRNINWFLEMRLPTIVLSFYADLAGTQRINGSCRGYFPYIIYESTKEHDAALLSRLWPSINWPDPLCQSFEVTSHYCCVAARNGLDLYDASHVLDADVCHDRRGDLILLPYQILFSLDRDHVLGLPTCWANPRAVVTLYSFPMKSLNSSRHSGQKRRVFLI